MPITNSSGIVLETPSTDFDQFQRCGVHRADQFALCHKFDRFRQLQFGLDSVTAGGVVTINGGAAGSVTLTLPTSSGTLALTGGAGGNSFTTIQPDLGTSPTASSSSDTLTLTSSDSSVVVTGSSAAKSINFQVASPLVRNVTGAASSNVLKTGDTMTGALIVPTGAAGTPSVLGGTSTSGMYFPGAVTAFSVSGAEAFRTNTLGITAGTTATKAAALYVFQNASNYTGILMGSAGQLAGAEWCMNFTNSNFGLGQNGTNLQFFITAADKALSVQPGPAGGAGLTVGYGFEVAYNSTSPAPTTLAAIVAKSGLQPGIYSRSRNSATGILNGFWSVGLSDRVMAGFYGVATTQTANSEVSYCGVAAQKAGTLTEVAQFLPSVGIAIQQAGTGLSVKEGSNCKQGVATLVGGTVTVANTSVTASSRIQLTPQTLGTILRPAAVGVSARTAGTSFTITSFDVTDTSDVAYEIFEAS